MQVIEVNPKFILRIVATFEASQAYLLLLKLLTCHGLFYIRISSSSSNAVSCELFRHELGVSQSLIVDNREMMIYLLSAVGVAYLVC